MKTLLTLLLTFLIPTTTVADTCGHGRDIRHELDSDGIRALRLITGAGSLNIEGSPDAETIIVQGRACAHSRRQLEAMELLQRQNGETLILETEIRRRFSITFLLFPLFSSRHAHIDVDVTVPDGLMLDIDDGSGPMEIRNVLGNLRVQDGSGSIRLGNVTGDVTIDDGSGSISIAGITGSLRVRNGSGSTDIRDVSGAVEVDDGSGSITIRRALSVNVRDGSGSIAISEIDGDVRILEDGSGSIGIRNIQGNVTIENTGSGSIRVQDVAGDLSTRNTGSGGVTYSGIGGRVLRDE